MESSYYRPRRDAGLSVRGDGIVSVVGGEIVAIIQDVPPTIFENPIFIILFIIVLAGAIVYAVLFGLSNHERNG